MKLQRNELSLIYETVFQQRPHFQISVGFLEQNVDLSARVSEYLLTNSVFLRPGLLKRSCGFFAHFTFLSEIESESVWSVFRYWYYQESQVLSMDLGLSSPSLHLEYPGLVASVIYVITSFQVFVLVFASDKSGL